MLTVTFPFLHPDCLERDLPAKLRHLADDIELLRRRGHPQSADLHSAPRLDAWAMAMTPHGLRLTGVVTGHPLLGDRVIMTSALWVADGESRWVRSLSRYYRLGNPAELKSLRETVARADRSKANGGDASEDDA